MSELLCQLLEENIEREADSQISDLLNLVLVCLTKIPINKELIRKTRVLYGYSQPFSARARCERGEQELERAAVAGEGVRTVHELEALPFRRAGAAAIWQEATGEAQEIR